MEKQQLVIQSKYKSLNGEVENIIETNELNIEFVALEQKKTKVIYRGTTLTVDKATFEGTGLDFLWASYDSQEEKWTDSNENDITLSDYGITVDGTPEEKDTIVIHLNDGVLTSKYLEHTKLFFDENNLYSYVSFTSDLPIQVALATEEGDDNSMNIITQKIEMDLGGDCPIEISVWNRAKQDIETNLILAKKVE